MSSGYGDNSGEKGSSKAYADNYGGIDWSKKDSKFFDGIRSEKQGARMNKITEWSHDTPTEPGDYACCRGDVEVQANVTFERFHDVNGQLQDTNFNLVSEYVSCFKFARLIYAPSELKGMS